MFTVKDGLERKKKDLTRSNHDCFSPLLGSRVCSRKQIEFLVNENHSLASLEDTVSRINLGQPLDKNLYFDEDGDLRREWLGYNNSVEAG